MEAKKAFRQVESYKKDEERAQQAQRLLQRSVCSMSMKVAIIAGCIILLLIIGAVVGGVVGSMNSKQNNSSPPPIFSTTKFRASDKQQLLDWYVYTYQRRRPLRLRGQ